MVLSGRVKCGSDLTSHEESWWERRGLRKAEFTTCYKTVQYFSQEDTLHAQSLKVHIIVNVDDIYCPQYEIIQLYTRLMILMDQTRAGWHSEFRQQRGFLYKTAFLFLSSWEHFQQQTSMYTGITVTWTGCSSVMIEQFSINKKNQLLYRKYHR